jgi:hypothetical protein
MKWLVWLLLLLNLGLLAYFNRDRILPSTPQLTQEEITPEKITVLDQKQIDALPKKAVEQTPPPPPPAATTCIEWGIFSTASLANAQSAIASLSLQATVKEQTSLEAKRFWVYKPPLKTIEEAQAKAEELKALGVEELFVVQEPKWKNAISFGVFEDEKLALKLLQELKAKGVKDAVKAVRNQGKGHASLLLNKLTDADVAALRRLNPEFPQTELKEVSCP